MIIKTVRKYNDKKATFSQILTNIQIGIPLTGLTSPHVCVCSKAGSEFSTSYFVVFLIQIEMRGIVWIADHHGLFFLFILRHTLKTSHFPKYLQIYRHKLFAYIRYPNIPYCKKLIFTVGSVVVVIVW